MNILYQAFPMDIVHNNYVLILHINIVYSGTSE